MTRSEATSGVFQGWSTTMGGIQVTRIDGKKYATIFDLSEGFEGPSGGRVKVNDAIGREVEFVVGPHHEFYDLPRARIVRVLPKRSVSDAANYATAPRSRTKGPRKKNRVVEVPAAPQFVTLANTRYLVRRTRHGYTLTGPRGATYHVVRNVHRPEWLGVVGHGGSTPRQFARGLTDRAGYLQVL